MRWGCTVINPSVLDDLDLALPDAQTPFVTKSAIAQARQRVGAAAERAVRDRRQGLVRAGRQAVSVHGLDPVRARRHHAQDYRHAGTSRARWRTGVPERKGFKLPASTRGHLTAVPTHLVRQAVFGPYGTNEMLYADEKLRHALNVLNGTLSNVQHASRFVSIERVPF